MEGNMTEVGRTVGSTVKRHSQQLRAKQGKESGRTVRESTGSQSETLMASLKEFYYSEKRIWIYLTMQYMEEND